MTSSNSQENPAGKASTSSLADMVTVTPETSLRKSISAESWIKVALLTGLFVWMNFWQIRVLVGTWLHDANWAHGFVIPLFGLYLLYNRRDELARAHRRVCLWGLPIMVFAIILSFLGFYPIGTYFISHVCIILMLFGLVLYLGGPQIIRITWLPILFLIFAMPIPDMAYNRIAVPLQEFAAKGTAILLRLFGVQISVDASSLQVISRTGQWHQLTVAEACSGIRSLMAFMALAVAWAYLEYRPVWQRIIIVGSAIPIVILANVMRVTITSVMYVVDKPQLGQDFMHEFVGLLMLIPAAGMLWLLSYLLNSIFVEVDEDDEPDASTEPIKDKAV